jgi:hypothetical protein
MDTSEQVAQCDPNAKPRTEVEQLQRRLDQAMDEAIERAMAYDGQNLFYQSRTSALTARLTVLAGETKTLRFALREIVGHLEASQSCALDIARAALGAARA